MQKKKDENGKIIIYILLAALIVVGCKRGLDFVQQVSFSYHQLQTETLDTLPGLQSDDAWIEESEEKCRNYHSINNMFGYDLSKLFAVVLLFLAGSNAGKGILLDQSDYDPEARTYHIIYMQNKDGSKQAAHSEIYNCHLQ